MAYLTSSHILTEWRGGNVTDQLFGQLHCTSVLQLNASQFITKQCNAALQCQVFSVFFSQQFSQEKVSSCQMNKALYLCKISLPYLALSDVTIKNILSRCSSEVLSKAPTTSFLFLDLHVSVSAPTQPKYSVMPWANFGQINSG